MSNAFRLRSEILILSATVSCQYRAAASVKCRSAHPAGVGFALSSAMPTCGPLGTQQSAPGSMPSAAGFSFGSSPAGEIMSACVTVCSLRQQLSFACLNITISFATVCNVPAGAKCLTGCRQSMHLAARLCEHTFLCL